MHTLSFRFGEFESVFCCPFIYFIWIYLLLSLYYVHMSGPIASDKVVDVESIIDWGDQTFYNIILMEKRVTERMLPSGTFSSWFCESERVDPTRTLNVLSKRKFLMDIGNLPLKPRSYRSRIMHTSMSCRKPSLNKKNTVVRCFFFVKTSLILFTNPSARAGYDTRPICKRSLTGLNSEFSFS